MLCVTLGSELSSNDHILVQQKLLNVSLTFFSGSDDFPRPLNFFPNTRVEFAAGPNMARICGGPSFRMPPWMQFSNPILENSGLTNALESLPKVELFPHFHCSEEIKPIIDNKASFARNTRFSNIQKPFRIKLDTNRTNTFANSFILIWSFR